MYVFSMLQCELNGYCHHGATWSIVGHTGLPARHHTHYAQGLAVENGMCRLRNLQVACSSVAIDYERYNHSSLYLLAVFRLVILHVVGQTF